MDTSRIISNFLRTTYGLGSGHAHEIAAAFLGFKSHAALLMSGINPALSLKQASYLLPDLNLIKDRVHGLKITTLPPEEELAKKITEELEGFNAFRGKLWLANSIPDFEDLIRDDFLQHDVTLSDELCDVMALTNASFFWDEYGEVRVEQDQEGIRVNASGTYRGETHEDKVNHGEKIDFNLDILFKQTDLAVAYMSPKIEATGDVVDPYA
ncbi:MAG: hypothetical protein JSS83_17650 [Cyanobacteria bacterium SZAS LIN-3]|nr:hypothetical protein [Cyanobacteria bacterium SZAS LIN-3]